MGVRGRGNPGPRILGKTSDNQAEGKGRPIEVSVCYAVYEEHPVVRKWIAITNRGEKEITLSHLSFEAVNIAPGPASVLQASAFYGGQPREIFFTGRVDDAAVLERNSRTGEGFVVMNEAPGYLKRTELSGWGEGVEAMYDTDLFPFERRLGTGETFTSAKSSIAFCAEGRGTADPRWVMPSYTSQILMRKGADYQPPWIYNTWEPFERGITRSITSELIAAAGRMGLDVFTIDDGWQADYGDNAINRQSFENGLEEIQARAGKAGNAPGIVGAASRRESEHRGLSPASRVVVQGHSWASQGHRYNGRITGRHVPRHALPGGGRQANHRLDQPLSS